MSTAANRVTRFHDTPLSFRIVTWALTPFIIAHLVLATISGYRAIVQVYAVEIGVDGAALHPGTTIHISVATSGRAPADAVLEMRQGTRAETLAVLLIKGHRNGVYNPFTIHVAKDVVVTSEQLVHFVPGPARLRLTGNGRSQWLRVPPPVITERPVVVGN